MNKTFASDNYSGVHKKILEKIIEVNVGHASAYGSDDVTNEAVKEFKRYFGDVEVYFVINGTGSNVLSLEALKNKTSGVLCADSAHIFQDETGAPSKITGMQLITIPSEDGKFDIALAKSRLNFKDTFHKPNIDIISISQTTESGTIYTIEEIKNISKFAKENGMYLHMDGARIANAAVALGCSFKELSGDLGVDILSFGGTKNGLMYGEAIIFFNKNLAENFTWIRKQNLQLVSKMRFLSAQFIPYLKDNIWYECAKNANDIAKYLEEELLKINIKVTNQVSGNTVFAILPKEVITPLQEFCHFYIWNENLNEIRLVTSFDSTKEDVDSFIKKLKDLLVK